jgi:hypothetical protein
MCDDMRRSREGVAYVRTGLGLSPYVYPFARDGARMYVLTVAGRFCIFFFLAVLGSSGPAQSVVTMGFLLPLGYKVYGTRAAARERQSHGSPSLHRTHCS